MWYINLVAAARKSIKNNFMFYFFRKYVYTLNSSDGAGGIIWYVYFIFHYCLATNYHQVPIFSTHKENGLW